MKRRNSWPHDFDFEDYPDAAARASALESVGACPRGMIWVNLTMTWAILAIYLIGLRLFPDARFWVPISAAIGVGFVIQFWGERWHTRRVDHWLDQLKKRYNASVSQDKNNAH